MKKLLSLLTLVISLNTFAYNNKYFDIEGGTTKNFNLKGEETTVSLRWEVQSPNGMIEPSAMVLFDDNGLGCKAGKNILLFAGYDQEKKLWQQSWETKIEWAGDRFDKTAELANCLIKVTHPHQKPAYVNFYWKEEAKNQSSNANFVKASMPDEDPEEEDSCDPRYEDCDNSNGRGGGPDDTDDGSGNDRDSGGTFDGGGYNDGNSI